MTYILYYDYSSQDSWYHIQGPLVTSFSGGPPCRYSNLDLLKKNCTTLLRGRDHPQGTIKKYYIQVGVPEREVALRCLTQ